jgi:hypothetical protein
MDRLPLTGQHCTIGRATAVALSLSKGPVLRSTLTGGRGQKAGATTHLHHN